MQGFFILLRSEITLFYHKRNEKERTDTPAKIIKEAAKRPIRKAEKNGAQKSKLELRLRKSKKIKDA